MLQRTPLHDVHHRLGAHVIEFGGWEMPLRYTGILEEHRAVRSVAGVFDISHMGELTLGGRGACEFLNHVLTNDVRRLEVGRAQYSLLCNEAGGVVDDLYVYCIGRDDYLLMVNAGRIGPDMEWLEEKLENWSQRSRVVLKNEAPEWGALAVQGPAVPGFIDDVFQGPGLIGVDRAGELEKNQIDAFRFSGEDIFVARTGYTGEDGFEIIAPVKVIEETWDRVMTAGASSGLVPCGLGARDTLRLEMCYPLYGHELTEQITPLEAGLGFFVKLDKGGFIGREALAQQKEKKPARKCVAFKLLKKAPPPRAGYTIWGCDTLPHKEDKPMLGEVTSGTQSPSLGVGIGLGYVPREFAQPDTSIEINIRNVFQPAVIVKKPIYRPARIS